MKTIHFLFALVIAVSFAFTSPENPDLTECPAPTNITIVSQNTSSVSFDWDDCGCALTEYRVFYVKGGQTSQEASTGSSNISFTELTMGGTYQFHFYTVCGGGVSSIIIEDVVFG